MAETPPHPRDVYGLAGHEESEKAFVAALHSGRLHHAWLICGPEGVGKATFAYRAARRLLGAAPDPQFGVLGARPEDPECRLVAAGVHPDLIVLERRIEDGRLKKNISVDDARALPGFFAKTPSRGHRRVAIIDAADDMNLNSANALLKTLEEPSAHGVLLLVAHAPGRIMATIRSRCRRLQMRPWSDTAVAAFAERHGVATGPEADRLALMARGSPGRALALAQASGLALDDLARALTEGRMPPAAELQHFADGLRGGEGAARMALFLDRLQDAVRAKLGALAQTTPKPRSLEAWAAAFDRWSQLREDIDAVNLDRPDAFWACIADLNTLTRAVRC